MSKCGICGNEILTGDIHWAIGICNNCYNKLYKSDEQKYVDMLHKENSELLVNSLAEKDRQITELKKQLEEKEKDNQFLKKMYLSERIKNDNYHTEKYGLDKPVEELRKIKLTPKEKEIYYKGFDNCERQFATHIAELEQQLEEKEKYTYTGKEVGEIERKYETQLEEKANKIQELLDYTTTLESQVKKWKQYTAQSEENRKFEQEKKNIAWKRVKELESKLCSQPAEIVEKIREWGQKHYNWVGDGTGYDGQDYNECIGFNKAIDQLNEILDTILKEYQK